MAQKGSRVQDMGVSGARQVHKTWVQGMQDKDTRYGCMGCKTWLHYLIARHGCKGRMTWLQDMATLPDCKTWVQGAHDMAARQGHKAWVHGVQDMGTWGARYGCEVKGCKRWEGCEPPGESFTT